MLHLSNLTDVTAAKVLARIGFLITLLCIELCGAHTCALHSYNIGISCMWANAFGLQRLVDLQPFIIRNATFDITSSVSTFKLGASLTKRMV